MTSNVTSLIFENYIKVNWVSNEYHINACEGVVL